MAGPRPAMTVGETYGSSSMRFGIPLLSGSLGVLCADEMEGAGDQGADFIVEAGDIAEEAVHRRFELGEGWEVLVVERLALEQPPPPLDQVEVRRISRQVDQPDAATVG